jgi:hypothetical protein
LQGGGYGRVRWNRRATYAHRVALALHLGRPLRLDALHKCVGSPACCNPAHLYEGDDKQNVADREAAGRTARGLRNARHTHPETTCRGEGHPKTPLKTPDVIAMRAAHAAGARIADLARGFKISDTAASAIVNRRSWRHVP